MQRQEEVMSPKQNYERQNGSLVSRSRGGFCTMISISVSTSGGYRATSFRQLPVRLIFLKQHQRPHLTKTLSPHRTLFAHSPHRPYEYRAVRALRPRHRLAFGHATSTGLDQPRSGSEHEEDADNMAPTILRFPKPRVRSSSLIDTTHIHTNTYIFRACSISSHYERRPSSSISP